jgi:predicted small secreted protein
MKTTLTLLGCITLMLAATSCNTVEGIGRDVRYIGGKIEQKADQAAPY